MNLSKLFRRISDLLFHGPILLYEALYRRRKRYRIFLLNIRGSYPEAVPASVLRWFRPAKTSYFELVRRLELAAEDPKIEATVIVLNANRLGLARTQEIARLIAQLREKGKKTVAVIEGGGTKEYALAASCERIVLSPSAALLLTGLSFESVFLGELLDRYDIEPDIESEGKYKSAGEILTRKEPSEAARQMMNDLVKDLQDALAADIAKGRGTDATKARVWIDGGPYTPQRALEAGIVDEVAYLDEARAQLRKQFGKNKIIEAPEHFHHADRRARSAARLFRWGTVALVTAVGPIVETSSRPGEVRISSRSFTRVLRGLRKDKSIKAVVLRLSSPGGSASASDLLHRELIRLKKKKPLIVSIGDVAASGGYYLAVAGDAILTEKAALTGSIGVISGKVSLRNFYKRIGVAKEVYKQGENAAIFSDYGKFSDEERKRLKELNGHFYAEFKSKVAAGRKLSEEKVEEAAQGRVFAGSRALEYGLADSSGGLAEAIRQAADRIGVPAGCYPDVVVVNALRASLLPMPRWSAALPGAALLNPLLEAHDALEGLASAPAYYSPFLFRMGDSDNW